MTPPPPSSSWTVIRPAPHRRNEAFVWARCVCGTEREVCARRLRSGETRHCGCKTPRNTKAATEASAARAVRTGAACDANAKSLTDEDLLPIDAVVAIAKATLGVDTLSAGAIADLVGLSRDYVVKLERRALAALREMARCEP